MKIEINISKKIGVLILVAVSLLIVSIGVIAYGTNNPQNFGHTLGEIKAPEGCNGFLKYENGIWTCTSSINFGTHYATQGWVGPYDYCALSEVSFLEGGESYDSCKISKSGNLWGLSSGGTGVACIMHCFRLQ